ncbi:MAG: hypothetical protein AB1894_23820 [Chloroflexota bacterium]
MKTRSTIATALALIGIGAWFLVIQISPLVKSFAYGETTWPIPIIGIGAGLALIGLLTWTPGMFIPASIVSGIGGLLYWQNATGNLGSWAYAWTLIPGFVGFGVLLAGLLGRERGAVTGGFWTIFYSLVLFGFFGSFLGGWSLISQLWPVLIIVLGLYILARATFRRRQAL